MAMSKFRFVLLFVILILVLGGGVAIVLWRMNVDLSKSDGTFDEINAPSSRGLDLPQYPGSVRSAEECRKLQSDRRSSIMFAAKLGQNKLAVRETLTRRSGFKVVRNAYWLTGNSQKDNVALKNIELQACEGKVPVIVIKMRPSKGLQIHHGLKNWDFYKPPSNIETWPDYDKKLNFFISRLAKIPSLVILEPDLLMFTYDFTNQQYRWLNSQYEDEFLKRAQRVITRLKKSWIYVDAGNAVYLSEKANTDQMAKTLLRLSGLRGFSINTFHFVNRTYNEAMARHLHCRTGLHYVVDTSRNGGSFSRQSISNIERCLFDPPHMKKGQYPAWSWGSKGTVRQPRSKRWIHQYSSSSDPVQRAPGQNNQRRFQQTAANNPSQYHSRSNTGSQQYSRGANDNTHNSRQATSSGKNQEAAGLLRSASAAAQLVRAWKRNLRTCVSQPTFMTAHDASVWLKTPGESDGRFYPYGTFHSCLVSHTIPCDDNCQAIQSVNFGSRPSACNCDAANNMLSFPLTKR